MGTPQWLGGPCLRELRLNLRAGVSLEWSAFGCRMAALCRAVRMSCAPSSHRGGGGSHGVNSPLLCSAPRLPLHSFQLTVEMFDYMDCELRLSESGKLTKEEAQPTRVQCDSSGPTAR